MAVLVSAPAISVVVNRADPESTPSRGLSDMLTAPGEDVRSPVRDAALTFVRALSAKDAETVWMYASEEEQDAFGTEQAAYEAYAETFPALADANRIVVERGWQEGDTPFIELALRDGHGSAYRATMGFWLSDAGDWQLISCDVQPVSDVVARR